MGSIDSVMKAFTTIAIDLENYQALKDLGKAGDSFNDVLKKLLAKEQPINNLR